MTLEYGTNASRGREGAKVSSRHPILAAAILVCAANVAPGQMMPGPGGMPGGMQGGAPGHVPGGAGAMPDEPPAATTEKPDVAAKKAYRAATKALDKAKELESSAAAATNPDKKAKDLDKLGDQYNVALDAFTEVLSNKPDMVEAWDQVGYVHLRLSAYREAIDDYNHTLALKPELMEAIEHRAEAYLAIGRLDEVKVAYMDLFSHAPDLAGQLMASMQKWVAAYQADPHGMRVSDIAAFGKWVAERDGIAKQTASLPQ
jgi:tetratricopeptide (TPR) repeat protein